MCVIDDVFPFTFARPAARHPWANQATLIFVMDSKHDRSGLYAPGVSYDGGARLPGSDGPATNQPKLDEHLVQSESREEMVKRSFNASPLDRLVHTHVQDPPIHEPRSSLDAEAPLP